jgi:predicted aminopeptidase
MRDVSLRRLSRLLALAAVLPLAGCETLAYYAQAIHGELSLLSAARPVAEVIADPGTAPALRARLELARRIRAYASSALALPDNGSYRSYAALDRPYVVWNVIATPEFSLEPVQSCFLVAGCVAYRGFFAREDAERYAAGLHSRGYDVLFYGVPAFSTLGRFDDPLLSTFIGYSDAELARLVFHELAHQVVYVKDDSTFNESFAVTVEREGVRRWLEATGRGTQLAAFAQEQRRREAFLARLDEIRARLRTLYASRLGSAAMRERKQAEMAQVRALLAKSPGLSGLEANNALLASFALYTQLVPAFQRLLAEEDGDLKKFYQKVKTLALNAPSNRGPLSEPRR